MEDTELNPLSHRMQKAAYYQTPKLRTKSIGLLEHGASGANVAKNNNSKMLYSA